MSFQIRQRYFIVKTMFLTKVSNMLVIKKIHTYIPKRYESILISLRTFKKLWFMGSPNWNPPRLSSPLQVANKATEYFDAMPNVKAEVLVQTTGGCGLSLELPRPSPYESKELEMLNVYRSFWWSVPVGHAEEKVNFSFLRARVIQGMEF